VFRVFGLFRILEVAQGGRGADLERSCAAVQD
jgi:hypothetical protein